MAVKKTNKKQTKSQITQGREYAYEGETVFLKHHPICLCMHLLARMIRYGHSQLQGSLGTEMILTEHAAAPTKSGFCQ